MPSAPRLNLSGATSAEKGSGHAAERAGAATAERLREVEAQALSMLREMVGKTENVGDRFAEEARRIHYNEAPARNIRGVTTPADARALIEEGIDVLPLPGACVPKESLQ